MNINSLLNAYEKVCILLIIFYVCFYLYAILAIKKENKKEATYEDYKNDVRNNLN